MIKIRFYMMLFILLIPVGCIHEELSDCLEYTIIVKIVDAEGNDITQNGVVSVTDAYLFDENGFVRMLPKESGVDYKFSFDMYLGQTIVLWGNLKSDTLYTPEFSPGTPLEEARIELLKNEDGYQYQPTDLFHSYYQRTATTRSFASEEITMIMKRSAASIDIRTLHFADYFETTTTGSYYFVVRNTSSVLDFQGRPTDDRASHKPLALKDKNGDLYTAPFRVFPGKEDQSVLIDICRDDEVLFTIKTDKEGSPLKAERGSHLAVLIDFLGTGIDVTVKIEPWDETEQITEI